MSKDAFILSAGQAHEIELAMNRSENGEWTSELVYRLSRGGMLGQLRQVLLGNALITMSEHIIDLDAEPFTPDGWRVKEHQKGGQFKWNKDAQKDALWLAEGQQNGKRLSGNKLRKEMKDKPVLNANVLDYLLSHPHLIPEKWKDKYVFFWGTIYRDSVDDLCVRCLRWDGGRWHWVCLWLGDDFYGHSPAALRAS